MGLSQRLRRCSSSRFDTEPFRPPSIFVCRVGQQEAEVMRSIFLWLIGIPIPIILLLALCTHHF